MDRMGGGILILVLTLSVAADQDNGGDKSDTPAEQYKALLKEYQDASGGGAACDEERMKFVGRVYKLRYKLALRFLELAERNPTDPIALARLDPGGLTGEQHPLAGLAGGHGQRGGEGLCDPAGAS